MPRYRFSVSARRRSSGEVADSEPMTVYSDTAGTVLADISLTAGGSSIAGSQVTLDAIGGVVFYGPPSAQDTLYVRFPDNLTLGVQTIYADYDPRVDALEALIGGVPGGASILVWENLTQSVIDGKAAAGEALRLAAGTHSVPVALNVYPAVPILGEACDFGGSKGTKIQGTSGQDVFLLDDTAGDRSGYRIEHLKVSGGRNQLVLSGNDNTATHLDLRNVEFDGPSSAGVLIDQGSIEEWYLDHVSFSGGVYGFRKISGGDADVTDNYIDKCTFKDCTWGGQSKSGVHVDARTANVVTFLNPVFNLQAEHALYWRGGLRSIAILNPATEQVGTSGKHDRTTLTGTVSSGATSGTLASATGWAPGDQITIAGAGASGTDFEDTVTISGTTATWATPTSTTVVDPKVTNAKWDEFHFAVIPTLATPAHILMLGGIIAAEATLGRLRYSVRMPGAYATFVDVTGGTGNDVPAYVGDPAGLAAVGGNLRVRTTGGREFDTGTQSLMDALALLGQLQVRGALDHDGSTAGFYGTAPIAKPTVSGSRLSGAALQDLLTELANLGLITDSTSA